MQQDGWIGIPDEGERIEATAKSRQARGFTKPGNRAARARRISMSPTDVVAAVTKKAA